MNYSIVVPTLNGGDSWKRAAAAISSQRPEPNRVLVIDSGSVDQTAAVAVRHGFDVLKIESRTFDHGGTRQMGVGQLKGGDIVVFLTQDAILLESNSIARLLEVFGDARVGAAYGRQIAGRDASVFETHAREFNYPQQSAMKSRQSIPDLGIKAAFCSNSFAAYRLSALKEVGGFSAKTLFAEDMLVAAKMILAGHCIAYQADATCEHWHNYTISQEFSRAFDIGVFHRRESWILEQFGKAQGEGARLIKTGLRKIISTSPNELPTALMKYLVKVLGYTAGRMESILPLALKSRLSMNRAYWMADD